MERYNGGPKEESAEMQRAMEHLLSKHKPYDVVEVGEPMQSAAERQIKSLNAAIDKVDRLLATHGDKIGKSGKPKQSNIADKTCQLLTSKGVVQGCNGIALADSKQQVVVHAEAFREIQENGLPAPML